jgi:hypothetical protein
MYVPLAPDGFAFMIAAIWSQMKAARMALTGTHDYLAFALEASCWGLLAQALSGDIQWNKPFWLGFMLLAVMTHMAHTSDETRLRADQAQATWSA